MSTSFPGSLFFLPFSRSRGWEEERPWERGCIYVYSRKIHLLWETIESIKTKEKHCLTNWCQLLFICPVIDHGYYYTTLLKLLGICRLNFQWTALWQNCQQGRCMRTKTDVNNLCFTITTNQLSNSQLLLIDTSHKI